MSDTGALYLVPAPLDFGCEEAMPLSNSMPDHTLKTAASLQQWICENAKSARAYLKRIDALHPLAVPIQSMVMQELPREIHKKGDHQGSFDARGLLAPAMAGHNMGLISEAGMPAVADPGSSVVKAAHLLGIPVRPLVGPVSLLLALAASGLNGQSFAFVGYLPTDGALRSKRITELEALAARTGQTQIFIETPYRNAALLAALLQSLRPTTRLATAAALTLENADCFSASVSEWKKSGHALDNRLPAVFCIGP